MAKDEFSFYHRFRVRYSEIDVQGIVFNAHYMTFFDTAIYEYMRDLPFDFRAHAESGQDFHTVKVVLEFSRPAHFDEEIDVFVRVDKMGRSSLTFAVEIYQKGHATLLVSGTVVWVNTDQNSHKSTPLPPELVKRIEGN